MWWWCELEVSVWVAAARPVVSSARGVVESSNSEEGMSRAAVLGSGHAAEFHGVAVCGDDGVEEKI